MKMNGGEPYIHLTWHQSIADSVPYTDADVRSIYKNYATKKRKDLNQALGMTTSEAGKVVAQVTNFYDLIEKKGDSLTKALLNNGLNAAKITRGANPNVLESMANKIVNDKKWMDDTLKSLQDVLDAADGFNEQLIEFFQAKAINPTSLATKGVDVSKLRIMDLEKKTGTSLTSLKKSLNAISSVTKNFQLPLEPQYISEIDSLLSSKTEFKGVSNIIRSSGQRVLNTQGFLLEAVIWGLLEGAINDNLIKGLEGEGISVDLAGGKGNKTDVALIKIGEDNKRTNIGFSMKSTEKGVTKTNYYGQHPMYRFFEMAKILNTEDEYLYDNLLASGKSRTKVAQTMNKYIAAKAAWQAVTGGAGDEIYFMVYLNKIVSVDEMYDNMASGAEDPFKLYIKGVTQIPSQNVRMVDAQTRSHAVLNSIRHMQSVHIVTKI